MSKNRLFNSVIGIALVTIVALTIREASATSTIVGEAETVRLSQRGIEADAARWAAMASSYPAMEREKEIYVEPGESRSQRSRNAEAARWSGITETYAPLPLVGTGYSERGLAADAARWMAIARYYMMVKPAVRAPSGQSSPRSQRSIEAEATRWNAIAEDYLSK